MTRDYSNMNKAEKRHLLATNALEALKALRDALSKIDMNVDLTVYGPNHEGGKPEFVEYMHRSAGHYNPIVEYVLSSATSPDSIEQHNTAMRALDALILACEEDALAMLDDDKKP